jgi:hypothetical protein
MKLPIHRRSRSPLEEQGDSSDEICTLTLAPRALPESGAGPGERRDSSGCVDSRRADVRAQWETHVNFDRLAVPTGAAPVAGRPAHPPVASAGDDAGEVLRLRRGLPHPLALPRVLPAKWRPLVEGLPGYCFRWGYLLESQGGLGGKRVTKLAHR